MHSFLQCWIFTSAQKHIIHVLLAIDGHRKCKEAYNYSAFATWRPQQRRNNYIYCAVLPIVANKPIFTALFCSCLQNKCVFTVLCCSLLQTSSYLQGRCCSSLQNRSYLLCFFDHVCKTTYLLRVFAHCCNKAYICSAFLLMFATMHLFVLLHIFLVWEPKVNTNGEYQSRTGEPGNPGTRQKCVSLI